MRLGFCPAHQPGALALSFSKKAFSLNFISQCTGQYLEIHSFWSVRNETTHEILQTHIADIVIKSAHDDSQTGTCEINIHVKTSANTTTAPPFWLHWRSPAIPTTATHQPRWSLKSSHVTQCLQMPDLECQLLDSHLLSFSLPGPPPSFLMSNFQTVPLYPNPCMIPNNSLPALITQLTSAHSLLIPKPHVSFLPSLLLQTFMLSLSNQHIFYLCGLLTCSRRHHRAVRILQV